MAIKLQGTNSAAAPGLTNDGGDGVVVGTDSVDISTGGTSRVKVDSSGRVMIGTTSTSGISGSADDLIIGSIGDSTSRGITFATTADAAIRWADAGDNAMGRIQYLNNTDIMSFHTANAERLRIDADGLKFNGDTAAANGLSDYEEGAWTPTDAADSLSIVVESAKYVKVGNLVHITCFIDYPVSSSSSNVVIGGLPFSQLGGDTYSFLVGKANGQGDDTVIGQIATGGSTMQLMKGQNAITIGALGNSWVVISGTYRSDT